MKEINDKIMQEVNKVFEGNILSTSIKEGICNKVEELAKYGYLGDYVAEVVKEIVDKEIKPIIQQAILLEKEKLVVEIPKKIKQELKNAIEQIEIKPREWGIGSLIKDAFEINLKKQEKENEL